MARRGFRINPSGYSSTDGLLFYNRPANPDPYCVVFAKFVALAAIAVASLVLILGIMRFSFAKCANSPFRSDSATGCLFSFLKNG